MPSLACRGTSNYPSSLLSFTTGPSLTPGGMRLAVKLDLVSLKQSQISW